MALPPFGSNQAPRCRRSRQKPVEEGKESITRCTTRAVTGHVWVVRVGGDDGELRSWHYIYAYSIEGRLVMRVRYDSHIWKTKTVLSGRVADSAVAWAQVDSFQVVGGGWRMPMVRAQLDTAWQVGTTLNADESAVLGAAWLAYFLAPGAHRARLRVVELVDPRNHTPHTPYHFLAPPLAFLLCHTHTQTQPSTLHPQPYTLDPKPYTLNPIP